MKYLLSIYQPDMADGSLPDLDDPSTWPPGVDLGKIAEDCAAVREEMETAGVWVFSGALHAADAATVVQVRDGQVVTTDGPYVEGKEHLGGLDLIDVPDLDAALEWGRKVAQATTLPIEVRSFQEGAWD